MDTFTLRVNGLETQGGETVRKPFRIISHSFAPPGVCELPLTQNNKILYECHPL